MTKPAQQKQPQAPKLPEKPEDNVVKEELTKGDVRPDGPGDETAPVKPDSVKPDSVKPDSVKPDSKQ